VLITLQWRYADCLTTSAFLTNYAYIGACIVQLRVCDNVFYYELFLQNLFGIDGLVLALVCAMIFFSSSPTPLPHPPFIFPEFLSVGPFPFLDGAPRVANVTSLRMVETSNDQQRHNFLAIVAIANDTEVNVFNLRAGGLRDGTHRSDSTK